MVGMPRSIFVLALWVLWALGALGATFMATAAFGQEYRAGEVRILQPWARASAGPARAAAAYMGLETAGAGDRLIAASSPAASRATLHIQIIENEIAKMRRVEAIAVDPGEATVLRPGGLHIMLTGLTAPLKEGARFPLTLTFEKAGKVEVEVIVRGIAAKGPAAD